MRTIGFSTGALALGDFRGALDALKGLPVGAVELSALRIEELDGLLGALDDLDLSGFRYVAVHAPSTFSALEEPGLIDKLLKVVSRGFNVILHPDSMHHVPSWRRLGERLCLENMDKRKPIGRTAAELRGYFDVLPAAGLCFDIAHARQVDGSMTEAYRLLSEFGDRLRQVHISEVNVASKHAHISSAASADFSEVRNLIPSDIPVIVEAQVAQSDITSELQVVAKALGG